MKSILLIATCLTALAMPTSAFAAGGGGKMMGAKAAGYDVNVACANWSNSAHPQLSGKLRQNEVQQCQAAGGPDKMKK
jgi:hypothetical protein